jgi:protocatechuate 3,4-dioxygenase beta subunit
MSHFDAQRRGLLGASSLLVACMAAPHWAAAALLPTPPQTRGPFYPDQLPLDTDNDLVTMAGAGKEAEGIVTHIHGQVLDLAGQPVRGVLVEIWQCDANGRYRHSGDRRGVPRDPGFQGYGKALTDGEGRYRFRTIRPVPYPGRAPHIHFALKPPEDRGLVTQMYVAGDPHNAADRLLNSIRDPQLRARLLVPLDAHPQHASELLGRFDIVLDADAAESRGG